MTKLFRFNSFQIYTVTQATNSELTTKNANFAEIIIDISTKYSTTQMKISIYKIETFSFIISSNNVNWGVSNGSIEFLKSSYSQTQSKLFITNQQRNGYCQNLLTTSFCELKCNYPK